MRQIYKNIVIMLAGLAFIAWIFEFTFLYFVIGGVVLISIVPEGALTVNRAWMKFAEVLGWINSRILLTVVYMCILVPLALISRLFKKDPLHLKWNAKDDSYYEPKGHTFTKSDLENPW